MNVYEEAHNLGIAIKESNEFKEYDRLRKEVEADPELDKMMKDFQARQIEMQAKQMQGETDQNLMSQIQSMYSMIATKPKAAEFMQAQARFSVMITDVYGIISEHIGIKMGL
jgi:cell fate (sporulation/competence/biofilm development) regulator YlbF (YheA/YmcA/DUF963 family)